MHTLTFPILVPSLQPHTFSHSLLSTLFPFSFVSDTWSQISFFPSNDPSFNNLKPFLHEFSFLFSLVLFSVWVNFLLFWNLNSFYEIWMVFLSLIYHIRLLNASLFIKVFPLSFYAKSRYFFPTPSPRKARREFARDSRAIC